VIVQVKSTRWKGCVSGVIQSVKQSLFFMEKSCLGITFAGGLASTRKVTPQESKWLLTTLSMPNKKLKKKGNGQSHSHGHGQCKYIQ